MRIRKEYHYLVAGLPELLLDEGRLKVGLGDLKTEFQRDLDSHDIELVNCLFLKFDNSNILNLLQKKDFEFDSRGNFSRELIEAQIKESDGALPWYMNRFIDCFKADDRGNPDMSWDNILETYFYQHLAKIDNAFLRDWFTFQLNTKNVISALICRRYNLQMEHQLIDHNDINENLLRSNARDFGIAQEFPEIEKIITAFESGTLLQREKALDILNWQWIDENVFFHYFSIERLLGFMLQFAMVERWMGLDRKEGELMFNKLLERLGKSFELPDEFRLQSINRK
jgi:hypothetical protein